LAAKLIVAGAAKVVPDAGGDTMWVDTAAAYDALSPTMQQLLIGLRVHYKIEGAAMERIASIVDVESGNRFKAAYTLGVDHPLVRRNPDTHRLALFMAGYWMDHIVGMTREESEVLLRFLNDHSTQPRFQCRWRWSVDDLVVWDERRTMHLALPDHYPRHRKLMDQLARMRSHDVSAENLSVLLIPNDLDETFGLAGSAGSSIGAEGEAAHLVIHLALFGLILGKADARHLGITIGHARHVVVLDRLGVVSRDQLETEVDKYARACARNRPVDTVFQQKMFFEIFKQHQGEYMGSLLSAFFESMGSGVANDDTDDLDMMEAIDSGLADAVNDNDDKFPPDFRLSKSNRKKKK